jgi:crotonobetainyl-CoA:carnitine CoA-transferase CaiB-like acyl-CoA transferase
MRSSSGKSDSGKVETLPLQGVRVLSMAEQFPGPFATLLLADLGADVIQIERPSGGDPSRRFPAFYAALNRNKRSIAVDLKTRDGVEVVLRMARGADVFLEGFRPGTVERLGVGYQELRTVNDKIVYVSISGFGQTGPYRDRPAHDLSYQALSGMLESRYRNRVELPSLAIADLSSGMFAALAVTLGLWLRDNRGTDSYIDVSMLDSLITMMATQLVPVMNAGSTAVPPEPGYGIYRTADGACLSLSVAHEDHFWRNLCRCTGLDQYAELTGPERVRDLCSLRERLAAVIATRPLKEWMDLLDKGDVPFAPVLALKQVATDAQVRARDMIVRLCNGGYEESHVRQPLVIGERTFGPTRPTPKLGEHSREVLQDAGYLPQEIEELIRKGIALDGQFTDE